MNDENLFEEDGGNIEENNNDRRERSLENENQEEQYKEEDKQYIIQYIQDYLKVFEDILNQIDEGIDNLDSYERTMQIKRSIDRLIETLYSQAASEDIDAEFETTKHTRDKSESMKRVREKRRKQAIEEVLSSMFAQQQKELMNAKHLSHGHETAHDDEAKKRVKSSIRGALFSVIAHRMDPRRRAGETADDNEKQAHIYGREAVGGALGALLKTFLTAVTAVVREIAKPLQHISKQETSFAKQVEESRNADSQKGRSV